MTVDDSELAAWASKAKGAGAVGVPVPPVQQSTSYTCGPAVLVAVLRYFGKTASEDELAAEAGTTPENGTNFDAMAAALVKRGLEVEPRDGLTPETIKQLLTDGSLVVLALQAWADELPPLGGYVNEWNAGHYVVPVAVDDETILFHDPSVGGRQAFLTRDEFARRWHDADSGDEFAPGFGLVVRGVGPVVWRRMAKLAPAIRMG